MAGLLPAQLAEGGPLLPRGLCCFSAACELFINKTGPEERVAWCCMVLGPHGSCVALGLALVVVIPRKGVGTWTGEFGHYFWLPWLAILLPSQPGQLQFVFEGGEGGRGNAFSATADSVSEPGQAG